MYKKYDEKRAALYIRVSTQYQVDKDSLPLQRQDLINYTKYALGIDSVEIFEDAGYSAKNTFRPAYQQMMARMRTGEFSHLVVWKIDRISRNLLDFAQMYAELKKLGVVFVSKNEQFDTSSAMGEAMLKIILVFAELERNMTSERVTAVMISRAANGQWNGGRVPYGYDYDPETSTFTVNPEQADVIYKIYDLYEKYNSLIAVTKIINDMGSKTRRGHDWSPTTVSKMLNNPWYTGVYRYNYHDEKLTGNSSTAAVKDEKEWILLEDHHPAIIDVPRFERIQANLWANRRSNKGGNTYLRKNIHVFAGLLKCGECGGGMQASVDRVQPDGFRPSMYLCATRRSNKSCSNKYIKDRAVGNFVLNYIANIFKAQGNFGRSTSLTTFERKLLRGEAFADIEAIEPLGLKEMFMMMKTGASPTDILSTPKLATGDEVTNDEKDLLIVEKRKKERALARLQSAFLYADDTMPEREYITERKKITDEIDTIDKRLEEIEKNSSMAFSLSDKDFMEKASYFILSQELQGKRHINYEKLSRTVDPLITKSFIKMVIKKIVILDGKIMAIEFANGITHKFLYKQE